MFDTLLVYENFPPGGLVDGDRRFEANGATFVPAALESLSHFPVTIAAHLARRPADRFRGDTRRALWDR